MTFYIRLITVFKMSEYLKSRKINLKISEFCALILFSPPFFTIESQSAKFLHVRRCYSLAFNTIKWPTSKITHKKQFFTPTAWAYENVKSNSFIFFSSTWKDNKYFNEPFEILVILYLNKSSIISKISTVAHKGKKWRQT